MNAVKIICTSAVTAFVEDMRLLIQFLLLAAASKQLRSVRAIHSCCGLGCPCSVMVKPKMGASNFRLAISLPPNSTDEVRLSKRIVEAKKKKYSSLIKFLVDFDLCMYSLIKVLEICKVRA